MLVPCPGTERRRTLLDRWRHRCGSARRPLSDWGTGGRLCSPQVAALLRGRAPVDVVIGPPDVDGLVLAECGPRVARPSASVGEEAGSWVLPQLRPGCTGWPAATYGDHRPDAATSGRRAASRFATILIRRAGARAGRGSSARSTRRASMQCAALQRTSSAPVPLDGRVSSQGRRGPRPSGRRRLADGHDATMAGPVWRYRSRSRVGGTIGR